jgi:hypothetical protein
MHQPIHDRLIAWLALAAIAVLLADAAGTVMLVHVRKSETDALITSDICRGISTPIKQSSASSNTP